MAGQSRHYHIPSFFSRNPCVISIKINPQCSGSVLPTRFKVAAYLQSDDSPVFAQLLCPFEVSSFQNVSAHPTFGLVR